MGFITIAPLLSCSENCHGEDHGLANDVKLLLVAPSIGSWPLKFGGQIIIGLIILGQISRVCVCVCLCVRTHVYTLTCARTCNFQKLFMNYILIIFPSNYLKKKKADYPIIRMLYLYPPSSTVVLFLIYCCPMSGDISFNLLFLISLPHPSLYFQQCVLFIYVPLLVQNLHSFFF